MKIEIPCADGTDANCRSTVEVSLPYPALELYGCNVTVDASAKTVRIDPTPEWLKRYQDTLSEYDRESVKEDGYIERGYRDFGGTICGACGSDQTYDADGSNISHL
ncbi:hypothetical protein [Paraburkholderia phenazinium]|jgi:hypothetical protein|uniref:Uncharacterized protein n=1 Tax=Paraburkholderia phenazinium TaxID=60549 RepID=A0A1N6EPX4_9BURK|nr:hypothetical protein [Paraburkholderia phenazinium]SIN84983.1 hypothetical protein SAMN05444168_0858 [Paraburkholderia phenazinium]